MLWSSQECCFTVMTLVAIVHPGNGLYICKYVGVMCMGGGPGVSGTLGGRLELPMGPRFVQGWLEETPTPLKH
jgi:hypothetical protein